MPVQHFRRDAQLIKMIQILKLKTTVNILCCVMYYNNINKYEWALQGIDKERRQAIKSERICTGHNESRATRATRNSRELKALILSY